MTDEAEFVAVQRIFEESGFSEAELEGLYDKLKALVHTLKVSDDLMHNVILHAQDKPYNLPDDPAAQLQYGMILYWIQNPPGWLTKMLQEYFKEHEDLEKVWKALQWLTKVFAPPQVTTAEYDYLLKRIQEKEGVIGPDGDILGTSTYEQLDKDWLWAFFNYLLNLIPGFRPAKFGIDPYYKARKLDPGESVRIAVIGDWGTGVYDEASDYDPATQVKKQIVAMAPDYLIHLGDVYYSGTNLRMPPGEESRNLVKMWPTMPAERSFTLNSNHEMYGGAEGYFGVALAANTPFTHQKSTSYFGLRIGKWALVGLDAAYHDPSALYMEGSLGDSNAYPHQYEFLKTATEGADRVIVFTHQTGMDVTGKTPLQLLTDIGGVLKPDYWYWGHVHLGVVYSQNSVVGKQKIAARCIGHSAVPFGNPYGLEAAVTDYKTVEWYANTPQDQAAAVQADAKIAKNGFAMLTLTETGITEEIYETGNNEPVWSASG